MFQKAKKELIIHKEANSIELASFYNDGIIKFEDENWLLAVFPNFIYRLCNTCELFVAEL